LSEFKVNNAFNTDNRFLFKLGRYYNVTQPYSSTLLGNFIIV